MKVVFRDRIQPIEAKLIKKCPVLNVLLEPVVGGTIDRSLPWRAQEFTDSSQRKAIVNPAYLVRGSSEPSAIALAISSSSLGSLGDNRLDDKLKKFTLDDSRLAWVIQSEGGQAFFPEGSHGTQVKVIGTANGRVRVVAKFEVQSENGSVISTPVESFEVLVGPEIILKYRLNFIDVTGPTKFNSSNSLVKVESAVKVANVFLRQAGVTLLPDDDPLATDNFTPTAPSSAAFKTILTRDSISFTTFEVAGVAVGKNSGHADIVFSVVPLILDVNESVSLPGGVCAESFRPAAAVVAATYRIAGRDTDRNWRMTTNEASAGIRGSVFLPITGLESTTLYGETIAHETGHVLGLNHRVLSSIDPNKRAQIPGLTDGLPLPKEANLMDYPTNPIFRQDFDLLQVIVMHGTSFTSPSVHFSAADTDLSASPSTPVNVGVVTDKATENAIQVHWVIDSYGAGGTLIASGISSGVLIIEPGKLEGNIALPLESPPFSAYRFKYNRFKIHLGNTEGAPLGSPIDHWVYLNYAP